MKWQIYQEAITILNVYVPNDRASNTHNYMILMLNLLYLVNKVFFLGLDDKLKIKTILIPCTFPYKYDL